MWKWVVPDCLLCCWYFDIRVALGIGEQVYSILLLTIFFVEVYDSMFPSCIIGHTIPQMISIWTSFLLVFLVCYLLFCIYLHETPCRFQWLVMYLTWQGNELPALVIDVCLLLLRVSMSESCSSFFQLFFFRVLCICRVNSIVLLPWTLVNFLPGTSGTSLQWVWIRGLSSLNQIGPSLLDLVCWQFISWQLHILYTFCLFEMPQSILHVFWYVCGKRSHF